MNVGRLRLLNQQVSRPTFSDPAKSVEHLGAVQAQDYLGGLWAIGLRTKGAMESAVEDAIARRAIVRTWPMRGTLHFVAAPDVRWMTQLLTPRVIAGARGRWRQLELDDAVFARAARAAERALVGGKQVRRDAMYTVWNDAGISTRDSRGLHILGYLAQTGVLCFGPRDGKQPTLTLLEEWLPPSRPFERDEALGALARRYFTSHGPATVNDLAWWSGLRVSDVRAGLELVRSELESEEVDGRTVWFAKSSSSRTGGTTAHLLPAWDEFTVAYRDRNDILDPAYARRVNAGGGVLKPVIVLGGQVVGSWQRTIGKGGVTVRPTFFRRITAGERAAVEAAAGRYGRFLGLTAVLQ